MDDVLIVYSTRDSLTCIQCRNDHPAPLSYSYQPQCGHIYGRRALGTLAELLFGRANVRALRGLISYGKWYQIETRTLRSKSVGKEGKWSGRSGIAEGLKSAGWATIKLISVKKVPLMREKKQVLTSTIQ